MSRTCVRACVVARNKSSITDTEMNATGQNTKPRVAKDVTNTMYAPIPGGITSLPVGQTSSEPVRSPTYNLLMHIML